MRPFALSLALVLAVLASCGGASRPRRPPGSVTPWPDPPPKTTEPGELEATAAPQAPTYAKDEVLGALVEDLRHNHLGEVLDLELDPQSGRVLGVCVELASAPEGASASMVVPSREVMWSSREGVLVAGVANGDAGMTERKQPSSTPVTSGEQRTVSGVVTTLAPPDDPTSALALQVRDLENRHHRVLLAPYATLEGLGLRLAVGAEITAHGRATRDARGMLLIAQQVTVGEREVVLRNERGEPTWSEPSEASAPTRVSIVALGRDGLATEDGAELEVRGFFLDPAAGVVVTLEVARGGERHSLPWPPLASGEGARFVLTGELALDGRPITP